MKRNGTELLVDAPDILESLVVKRLGAEQKSYQPVVAMRPAECPAPQPNPSRPTSIALNLHAGMVDFSTLPGMQELKLQRSMADVVGLPNPFFKLHETRAGATSMIDGRSYINFSSYDYLGLNGHEEVQAASIAAIHSYGTSCSASRLVAGERALHRDLETALAGHYGQEAAIVFVSGHATNVATIGALLGPKDLIIHDSLAHNSIVLGATLSGAERRACQHNNLSAIDELLGQNRHRYERVLIVVEGLYSMDGDCPDLAFLVDIKRRHNAWLMVDDAHGLGVLGERGFGLFEQCGVNPLDVDIWMGTLSKTLSSCGGYICGATPLVEFLKCMSGGFIYSVGLSPPLAAASLKALELLHTSPERVARLHENSSLFAKSARLHGLNIGSSEGHAIVPIVLHNSIIAVALSQRLFERGINVQPIIHPAVPERSARLRFFITSEHTREQIESTCRAIAEELELIGDGKSILTPRQIQPSSF